MWLNLRIFTPLYNFSFDEYFDKSILDCIGCAYVRINRLSDICGCESRLHRLITFHLMSFLTNPS